MTLRKNQSTLTQDEWQALIDAINAMHGMGIVAPRYRDFVRVHGEAMTTAVGMSWGVHTMPGMGIGRNFLAWHRQYLVQFERRMQVVQKDIALPYWDWTVDRVLPAALSVPSLLTTWGVTRNLALGHLPTNADVTAVMARTTFETFQSALEAIHSLVHIAVGGTMDSPFSPTDPLFWLHHANIDRIWAQWQADNPGALPANATEVLKPLRVSGFRMFGVRVSDVLDITTLGYQYS